MGSKQEHFGSQLVHVGSSVLCLEGAGMHRQPRPTQCPAIPRTVPPATPRAVLDAVRDDQSCGCSVET